MLIGPDVKRKILNAGKFLIVHSLCLPLNLNGWPREDLDASQRDVTSRYNLHPPPVPFP